MRYAYFLFAPLPNLRFAVSLTSSLAALAHVLFHVRFPAAGRTYSSLAAARFAREGLIARHHDSASSLSACVGQSLLLGCAAAASFVPSPRTRSKGGSWHSLLQVGTLISRFARRPFPLMANFSLRSIPLPLMGNFSLRSIRRLARKGAKVATQAPWRLRNA